LIQAGLIKRLGNGPLVAITPHGIDTVEEAVARACEREISDGATVARVWGYIGVLALVCGLLVVSTFVLLLWLRVGEPPIANAPHTTVDPDPSASAPE
jgi:hypothetical protein